MSSGEVWAMRQRFKQFIEDNRGATAIEYGLIAGLIAVVIIAALTQIGTALNTKLNAVSGGLN